MADSINIFFALKQKYQEAKSHAEGEEKSRNTYRGYQLFKRLVAKAYTPSVVEAVFRLCDEESPPADLSQAVQKKGQFTPEQKGLILYKVSLCYNGVFAPKEQEDPALAFFWCREAVKEGSIDAQYVLGTHFADGYGVKQNLDKAFLSYREAARRGHAKALHNLGVCYTLGQGVPEDKAQAFAYYQKAESLIGLPETQHNLGECYYYGHGVKEDKAQAVIWYKKAAAEGHADAQFALGFCYDTGKGIEQDKALAVIWYQKAANQGDVDAQEKLQEIYGRPYQPCNV